MSDSRNERTGQGSDESPEDISAQDPLKNGLDAGTGDPNDDRSFLMAQPPAQVDEEAVRENEDEEEARGD